MIPQTRFWLLVFSLTAFACQRVDTFDELAARREILQVLNESAQAWNAGDIAGYMSCYMKSDSLRFVGGTEVRTGWQTVLQKYRKSYPDKAAMGYLQFSDLTITVLAADAAFVSGRWALEREQDNPAGFFTLIFRKTEAGWRIVYDHTS